MTVQELMEQLAKMNKNAEVHYLVDNTGALRSLTSFSSPVTEIETYTIDEEGFWTGTKRLDNIKNIVVK